MANTERVSTIHIPKIEENPFLRFGMLPTVREPGKVLWVNRNLKLPFALKVGETTSLASMLEQNTRNAASDADLEPHHSSEIGGDTLPLRVRRDHGRTGLLAQVIFKDKEGHQYRDIEEKGMGMVYWHQQSRSLRSMAPMPGWMQTGRFRKIADVKGLTNQNFAEREAEKAEVLRSHGVDVSRTIAIISLDRVPFHPKEGSVQWLTFKQFLKKELLTGFSLRKALSVLELFRKEYQPVRVIRASECAWRINDINFTVEISPRGKQSELIIKDAYKHLVPEDANTDSLHVLYNYPFAMARNAAKNVRRMHRAGYVHKFLTTHNLRADGGFIDLDSVESRTELEQRKKNFENQKAADINDLRAAIQSAATRSLVLYWDRARRASKVDIIPHDGRQEEARRYIEQVLDIFEKELTKME